MRNSSTPTARRLQGTSVLLRYDAVKQLAAELKRPASTLIALAPNNDPFAITPARRETAEWFAKKWKQFGMGRGGHIRRLMDCYKKFQNKPTARRRHHNNGDNQ